MSFRKTKRAHHLARGDKVRFWDDGDVLYEGTIEEVESDAFRTLIVFDDGREVDIARERNIETAERK